MKPKDQKENTDMTTNGKKTPPVKGLRIREALPTDPIYSRGWMVQLVSMKPSSKSILEKRRKNMSKEGMEVIANFIKNVLPQEVRD